MLNIDSIQNGIVIDHIQAGKGMRIYELLELDKLDCCVALIKNARSSKLGRKDIIKIEGDLAINFDVLGFIDNNITVCTIKNGKLVKKENIVLPRRIKNVVKCKNPRCITSTEENLDQIFVLCDEKAHRYRCLYCEQAYKSHE
ncbi:aspartate carbamoyltransferase regulatory subunit [Hominenteromicrobium sp.]|uniref:aspartate carbamoyltransferase regulatory subunit n=1 Tax=Hominenteromicrobium sp. TaxID=3073581 RepID=UPI003A93473C